MSAGSRASIGRGDSIGNEPRTPPEQCPPNLPELADLGRASAQAAGPVDDTTDAAPDRKATWGAAAVRIVFHRHCLQGSPNDFR
jgi:hypothetical protein